jgi:hypothetical protein
MKFVSNDTKVIFTFRGNIKDRSFIRNSAAMRNISLNQDLYEVLESGFVDTLFKNADAPRLQGNSVRVEEFLSTEVPATRIARFGNRTVILNLRRRQNTGLCLDIVGLRHLEEARVLTTVRLGSMRTP